MKDFFCPNYSGCQIINIDGFIVDENKKNFYIKTYCESKDIAWESCKRYKTKKSINMCPDFVLPDSNLSIDDILDKLEEIE